MIDWSRCPELESTADTLHGAWRVKGHRVPVQALLDNYEADETPLSIARMFALPVATVRRVLHRFEGGTGGAVRGCGPAYVPARL
jgi:uncharacterized protein (DUF433 family)